METVLHIYHPKRQLLLLEYANRSSSSATNANVQSQPLAQSTSTPTNVLLFVGGMYDVFRSPSYIEDLAALFPRDIPGQKWRVMHVQLSSSGKCFGLYDLDRDVDEISTAITFIRSQITHSSTSPIVLMGHSTGCQDLLHYLVSPIKTSNGDRPTISGAIFQAPVSDREALLLDMSTDPATRQSYETCLAIAESTPPEHHKTTILPLHFSRQCMGPAPLTVSRFLSLASPGSPVNPGMDDYFSSDLSDRRLLDTFGRIGQAKHLHGTSTSTDNKRGVLFLPSGSDEHVPPSIDKSLLLARWKRAIETGSDGQLASLSPHSQIVKNALHDISGESIDARTARLIDMRGSVLRYLHDVVGDVGYGGHDEHSPWAIYERDRSAIEAERAGAGGTGSGGSGSGVRL